MTPSQLDGEKIAVSFPAIYGPSQTIQGIVERIDQGIKIVCRELDVLIDEAHWEEFDIRPTRRHGECKFHLQLKLQEDVLGAMTL